MLSTDATKPTGKPGQRKGKKKSGQRAKSGQQQATGQETKQETAQETAIDQPQAAPAETGRESVEEIVQEIAQEIHKLGQETSGEISQEASQEASREISAPIAPAENIAGEASAMETPAGALAVSADLVPVSPQTIANAYADYTRKSLEHVWTFFGRLAAARSPAEAFELQMQFAKETCEAFVAESQKISDLQAELARQRVMHFEGFVAKVTQTTFELRATRH
ncbi:phasin family protein [Bradyrhizobium liaoningense]|uniref:phasin family protein n=1 Tax=Bradyrhizobium liaoningense TaxID=43992 RepID=UPI001BA72D71|nr:phasin family protein [Bradyrhizobium liaoningense]MBR0719508.1 phasin family protein [Bradyrhizobium liaoningense]